MNELMDLVDDLKKELDNTKEVKEIKEIQKEVERDDNLLSLIEKYNLTKDEKIKEEILSSELFKNYKDKEIRIEIYPKSFSIRLSDRF